MLIALQEHLDRANPSLKWAFVAGLLAITVILLVAWRRALARLRIVEGEKARLLERGRLARDLHDELGAGLARLALLDERLPELHSGSVSEQVRHALEASAEIVWAVNPENDTLEDLVAFLFSQTDRIFSGTKIQCRTDAPVELPDVRLKPEVRKNLFLAAKEALANTLKHSGASEVALAVRFPDSSLEISVQDNGVGLPAGPTRRFGNGLKNMRQRMESIGGHFELGPGPTGGTRVVLRVSI